MTNWTVAAVSALFIVWMQRRHRWSKLGHAMSGKTAFTYGS